MSTATLVCAGLGTAWPLALAAGASFSWLVLRRKGAWTPRGSFGGANAVTTLRLAGVVALACLSPETPPAVFALAAALLLLLDGVDGWLARRSGTESSFGAEYDMEADALFVLVLSVLLALRGLGHWVLIAGLWRYGYVMLTALSPPPHAEPRSRFAQALCVVLIVCLSLAFVLPAAAAIAVAGLGTLLVTCSFLRSLCVSYGARWLRLAR
jgi:phosphatidylglycerophosphate synthase